jgi:hypothetical protein
MVGSAREQLVDLLAKLGDRAVAERHARHIHAAVLAASRGHDIGKDETGYFARPRRAKPKGPAKDFRDLSALAKKAIRGKITLQDWAKEWAASPPTVWRACRPALLVPRSRSLDRTKLIGFSAPGFTTVIPKPEAVLPALEAAIQRANGPANEKKRRRPDLAAHDVIAAVQSTYSELTGHRGGRVLLGKEKSGRLLRLGHDIDKLFGTTFFPRYDSTRLRTALRRAPARK